MNGNYEITRKEKHYKTKISLSKSMLRSNNGTYWKSARVLLKNNFNRTNVVDNVNGDLSSSDPRFQKCVFLRYSLIITAIDIYKMPTIQKKKLDRKYFVRYQTCTYVYNGLIFTYNKHNEISDHQIIAINMNVV